MSAPFAITSEPNAVRSLNILLVEDDCATRELMAACLEKYHHKVRCAEGVKDALEMLAEAPCEVLIADLGLLDGSGWFLLECAGSALCPYAIAVSGLSSPEKIADSATAGFRRHLVKPLVLADLMAALEEAAACLPAPTE